MGTKKPHIPDRHTLYTLLSQRWDDIYSNHFSEDFNLNHPKTIWSKVKNLISNLFNKLDISYIIFIIFSLTLIILIFDFYSVIFIAIVLSPLLLVFLYQRKFRFEVTDNFTIDLQKRITACVTDFLAVPITYKNAWRSDQDFYLNLHQELAQSMLIDHVQSKEHLTTFDDTYSITINDKKIITTECLVTVGDNEKMNTKLIFRGYFTIIELPRPLEGKIFLATDKGAYGNNYRRDIPKTPPPNATQLEWNEFNDLIRVSTTNETEVRYVLTPDFMVSLFDLWKDKHQVIRVSFINNKVYIIWEDNSVIIGSHKKILARKDMSIKIFKDTYRLSEKLLYVIHFAEALPTHLTTEK